MTLFLIDICLHVRWELSLHEDGEPPHFVTNELNFANDIYKPLEWAVVDRSVATEDT